MLLGTMSSKEGLYLGKQRAEKSSESTTKIKQTEKRDAKGEKSSQVIWRWYRFKERIIYQPKYLCGRDDISATVFYALDTIDTMRLGCRLKFCYTSCYKLTVM